MKLSPAPAARSANSPRREVTISPASASSDSKPLIACQVIVRSSSEKLATLAVSAPTMSRTVSTAVRSAAAVSARFASPAGPTSNSVAARGGSSSSPAAPPRGIFLSSAIVPLSCHKVGSRQ